VSATSVGFVRAARLDILRALVCGVVRLAGMCILCIVIVWVGRSVAFQHGVGLGAYGWARERGFLRE
jgi:hypothetical protein